MTPQLASKIRVTFELVEEDFPDKSTEFLMEVTCQRLAHRGTAIDHGDVAEALTSRGEQKHE